MPGPAIFAPFRKAGPRRAIERGSTVLPIPAAPATPNTPNPANGAITLYTRLSWIAAGATKYDIYLGTVPSPPLVVSRYVGTSYVPTLIPGTLYYWQIVAINDGGSTAGPVWSFTTPAATTVIVTLAGVDVTARALVSAASIREALRAAPNTANLSFKGASPPTIGQAIQIGLGSLDPSHLRFGGTVQDVGQSYLDKSENLIWPLTLIDYTFALNKRRPFGTWVNVSATIIAQYLVAVFAPGFTSNHVQAGLPAVSINFDGSADFITCLGQLATAIGGYADVDYSQDVHLFQTEATDAPDPIDATHRPLNAPSSIAFSTDLSQVRTRVYGKGHSETVPCNVAAGETILPIADAANVNPNGGQAIAGTISGGAQTQRLTYTGVQLGGGGSLVGQGAAPSAAPTLSLGAGTSALGTGVYKYAYTDVTPSGESLPSPLGSITTGPITAPSNPVPTAVTDNSLGPAHVGYIAGDVFNYSCTFTGPSGETDGSGASADVTCVAATAGGVQPIRVQLPSTLVAGVLMSIYRRNQRLGGQFQQVVTAQTPGSTYVDMLDLPGSNPNQPTVNTLTGNQVEIANIAVGVSPTTDRKVYRTVLNGSQLKLLLSFGNNTTTVFADGTADGSLGANAPVGDASGLTQPSGQVNAGSSSLLTASAGPFPANGGWIALSGGQVVRYTGISGNTLTGIPTSGPGSITTTVIYGSQVLPAPALTGVNNNNGLTLAMAKGSSVAIWVQRDDLAAQAALGLLERDANGNPTDGIHEYTITDGRMGEAALIALCDADLAQFSRPIVSVDYYTQDPKSKTGKTVHIDPTVGIFDPAIFDPAIFDTMRSWGLKGDFTIQSVDITFPVPGQMPLFHVNGASVSFTFSDLLRRVVLAA